MSLALARVISVYITIINGILSAIIPYPLIGKIPLNSGLVLVIVIGVVFGMFIFNYVKF